MRTAGYFQTSHFMVNGKWPSLTELMDTNGPFRLDFWRAQQLCHFLKTLPLPNSPDQNLTTLEIYCSEKGAMPHTLSAIYQLLITPLDGHRLSCLDKWERDLQCTFTTRQRQNILHFTFKFVRRHKRPTTK